MRSVLGIVVFSLVATFVVAYVAFAIHWNQFPRDPFAIWHRWDGVRYVEIAAAGLRAPLVDEGYVMHYTLYPGLVWLVGQAVGVNHFAALLVSNVCFALAAGFLYALARLDYSRRDAVRSVFYLAIFPTAYILHAGYSESSFVLFALASFYFARQGRWALCGLFGLMASGTRVHQGTVLTAAIAFEYMAQRSFRWREIEWNAAWLSLFGVGPLAYLVANQVMLGSPFAFLDVNLRLWEKDLAFPWEGFLRSVATFGTRHPSEALTASAGEIAFAFVTLVGCIAASVRMRGSYLVYLWGTWLMITASSFWLSIPRFALTMFPLFILMATAIRREVVHLSVSFGCGLLYCLLMARFVQGSWAF